VNKWGLKDFKEGGFNGFYKIIELVDNLNLIPEERGVYLIISPDSKPKFLIVDTGGYFKNRNPNVSLEILKENWVDQSIVLYIGQAGGVRKGKWSSSTLRDRLKKYFQFGQGKLVGIGEED
jgi:hypothetical protein